MTQSVNPPVTGSAAAHAQRIQEQQKAGERERPAAGQSTAEMYAARILPGYKRDEELREEARRRAERARGRWVPGDEPEEDEGEGIEEEPAAVDPLDNPERRAAKAAWRSASRGGYLAL